MRRIVRDYIAAAIDRERPDLERYLAGHLQYPEAFPLVVAEPQASIREIRSMKIAPRFPADYPPVDVVAMHVSITARTRRRFDDQAGAFFQQFAAIDLVAVPRSYEFDGLTVFFTKFRFKGQTAFAPFIFAVEDDGSFGFLPYRTEALTYRLLEDWFKSKRGPGGTANPAYCGDVDIKRATHRIFLGSAPGITRPPQHPSALFLRGASFDKPGELGPLAMRTRSSIASLKSAVVSGGADAIAAHLTPEGGRRFKEWFVTADQNERQRYASGIVEQQLFFIFDLKSVAVVYMRSPAGVQVMYFTVNADKGLLWVNSSHITVSDQVFKKDPLHAAASREVPFSSVAIR